MEKDNKSSKQNRVSVKSETLRLLYAKSGNKCAFQGCNVPIFEENGLYTGKCCHIESYSPNGPRYNNATTIEEKNSYSNLILLCSRHHTIIDNDIDTYTTEKLKEIKFNHENQYTEGHRDLKDDMLIQIEAQIDSFYSRLQLLDEADNTGLKMDINFDSNLDQCIKDIKTSLDDIFDILTDLEERDNRCNEELKKYIESEGVDLSLFKNIDNYRNPFYNRSWETHYLSANNVRSRMILYLSSLKVKILEYMQSKEINSEDISKKLESSRLEFEGLYQRTFYAD